MAGKVIELVRTKGSGEQQGTFGFSILGGAGTKFPAVVCEVDKDGPAEQSGKIQIGDQLVMLNGEDLSNLNPKDLVQKIRTAPSPSEFALLEDEELRHQVVTLLRKQERRARQRAGAISSSNIKEGEVKIPGAKKVSAAHSLSNASVGEEKDRKRKKHDKIIEVEPSVNISSGGEIVQVLDNRIIGRIEQKSDGPPGSTSPGSSDHLHKRQHRSPKPSPHAIHHSNENMKKSPSPARTSANSEEGIPHGSPPSTASHSPRISMGSTGSLEQKTALSPSIGKTAVKSASMDSFSVQSASSAGSGNLELPKVAKGTNGENISYSASSGLNNMGEGASCSSYEEKAHSGDYSSRLAEATTVERSGFTVDSGVAIHIPRWSGQHMSENKNHPRGSLSEEVLVTELERKSSLSSAKVREVPEEDLEEEAHKQPSPPTSTPASSVSSGSFKRPLISEAKREELMMKYRGVPTRSPSRRRHDPYADAVSLARRLYMLDGFKKSEVSEKLADPSKFGQIVAQEYLKFFEFEHVSLDNALHQFLSSFSLSGESQERERVMTHFSQRYFECNPDAFPTQDTVHGLTVALLLLNTDLHTDHGGQKMSFSQFVLNLEGIGVKVPRDLLKKLYDSIRRKALVWTEDDDQSLTMGAMGSGVPTSSATSQYNHSAVEKELEDDTVRTYHVTIPGTFVEVELPGNAPTFKEGFVMRKNVMEGPHKKVPRGKRQWKPYYALLKGFLLYFAPPRGELHLDDTSSAVAITHCLAMKAADYRKKNDVMRVTTSDWHVFLLQTTNVMDMQRWIGAINTAAALYSSQPLAAPISSHSGFQRPTFPLAPTKNSEEQQIQSHEANAKSLEKEIEEHQAYKPTGKHAKHGQLQDWFDKFEFIQFETHRFHIYLASLTSNVVVDYNAPLPSGLVPSPSISTLATTGNIEDEISLNEFRGGTPPLSPSALKLSGPRHARSPLLGAKHAPGYN